MWATDSQHYTFRRLTFASLAQGVGTALAQPYILALPRLLEPIQRPDRLLEIPSRLDTVEVVEVGGETEPPGRVLDERLDVFFGVVRPTVEGKTALAGNEELLASARGLLDPVTDERLVVPLAVDSGRVPEGTAEGEGLGHNLARLGVDSGTVTHTEAHSAESHQ